MTLKESIYVILVFFLIHAISLIGILYWLGFWHLPPSKGYVDDSGALSLLVMPFCAPILDIISYIVWKKPEWLEAEEEKCQL